MSEPFALTGAGARIERHALISADGFYRYWLTRAWSDVGTGEVAFVMLNPSKADALVDDPTVRRWRCIDFARRWGFARLVVVNLFAFRATDYRALNDAINPVGAPNDQHLRDALTRADRVVVAWGSHVSDLRGKCRDVRSEEVAKLITEIGVKAWCLGITELGHPRHPLMLPKSAALEEWQRDRRLD